jgi:hypothetical protein
MGCVTQYLGVNIECLLVITFIRVHNDSFEVHERSGTLNRLQALPEGTYRESPQDITEMRYAQRLAPFTVSNSKYFLGGSRLTVPPLVLGYCDDLRSLVTVTVTDDPKL